jgi:Zn-dependent protease
MLKFNKKEFRNLIIAIIILTIVFAFDDKSSAFVLSNWLTNFIRILVVVFITLTISRSAQKLVATRYGVETEYQIWSLPKFKHIKFLPIGPILAILITILSNGKFYFAAIDQFNLIEKKGRRLGTNYPHTTEFESAKIAVVGPLANMVFALILSLINGSGIFSQLIFVNWVYAIYSMLPIPNLDGSKIFFGSWRLYIFSIFIMAILLLLILL